MINGLNPSIPLPLAGEAGLPNLGGAKVSLVVENATPDSAATKGSQVPPATPVIKLASIDGVQALIGAYDPRSPRRPASAPSGYEIPFVNADSPATFLTDAGRDWFFRIGPSWRQVRPGVLLAAAQDQNIKVGKIAVLYAQDKAGQDVVTSTGAGRGRSAGNPQNFGFARTARNPGGVRQGPPVQPGHPAALLLAGERAGAAAGVRGGQCKPKAAMSSRSAT